MPSMKFNLSDLIDLNLARQFFVCAHHANGLMQSRKPEPFQFTEWRRPMAYASVIVEDSGERGVLFRLHHRCGHGVIEVSVQIFLNIVERLERSERYFSAQWIPKGKERGDGFIRAFAATKHESPYTISADRSRF